MVLSPATVVDTSEAHKGHTDALYVVGDLLTIANRTAINTWALGARLPTIYAFREDVEAGALMSYGTSLPAFNYP
jgi:ABC-type uncharacterized transport system substrate-binding protein